MRSFHLFKNLIKHVFCIKASKSLYKSADMQLVGLVEFMGTVGIRPNHKLRTPIEGINQRNLKNRANVSDKICFGCI